MRKFLLANPSRHSCRVGDSASGGHIGGQSDFANTASANHAAGGTSSVASIYTTPVSVLEPSRTGRFIATEPHRRCAIGRSGETGSPVTPCARSPMVSSA